MTRQQAINKQITEIMNGFDFETCYKIFQQNDWTYAGIYQISIDDLKECAKRLLYSVSKNDAQGMYYNASGRFRAEIYNHNNQVSMELLFTPKTWESEPIKHFPQSSD